MYYRKLGNSDIVVSEIALGSWLTYGAGVDVSQSAACVRKALDLGITFIDTANIYGRGTAESFLGETLAGISRGSYVLATKLFFPMTDTDRGLSRAQIEKQLDASLKRLRTDYVDLYQCHRYDPQTPLEETMQALSDAVASGKVREIGFSEWPADKILQAQTMAGVKRFVSSQPQYSMLWRYPEREVIPLCKQHAISQIVWSPLAQGLLTGKYKVGAPVPQDSRAASPSMGGFFDKKWLEEPMLNAIAALKPLAESEGLTQSQMALAWCLRDANVASAITGATKPQQVEENAGAAGRRLRPETLAQIDMLLAPLAAAA